MRLPYTNDIIAGSMKRSEYCGKSPSICNVSSILHISPVSPLYLLRSLIGKLHIGYLEKSPKRDDDDDALSYLPTKNINNGFAMPAPRLPTTIAPVLTATTSEEQDDEVEDLNPWEKPEQK